jgi:glycosyltransferase involved in cell wall biosynthesis
MEFYVSPSRQEEFGQTLIEALALGRPIATTPSSGPREIVKEVYPHTISSSFSPEDLADAITIAQRVAQESRTRKQIGKRMWRYRWDKVKCDLRKCIQIAMCND